mmetsp:Transcript_3936/g.10719  ORF Transcript_3936/g.10719 Transcript_3936/m.10719 type:complete len:223 (-) Transcript_3936:311-979(-)
MGHRRLNYGRFRRQNHPVLLHCLLHHLRFQCFEVPEIVGFPLARCSRYPLHQFLEIHFPPRPCQSRHSPWCHRFLLIGFLGCQLRLFLPHYWSCQSRRRLMWRLLLPSLKFRAFFLPEQHPFLSQVQLRVRASLALWGFPSSSRSQNPKRRRNRRLPASPGRLPGPWRHRLLLLCCLRWIRHPFQNPQVMLYSLFQSFRHSNPQYHWSRPFPHRQKYPRESP